MVGGPAGRRAAANYPESRHVRVARRLLLWQGMKRLDISPRFLPALAIAVVLGLATSPALAQPSLVPETPVASEPTIHARTTHYGLWVAALDVAGLVAAISTENGAILFGTYMVGGPAVHLFHGNFKGAAASFGLRTGLAIGGALIGSMGDCGGPEPDWCKLERTLIGGLAGVGTALAIDWFWLSKKTTYVQAEPPALLRAGSLRANPDFQVSQTGSMMLGLSGSF